MKYQDETLPMGYDTAALARWLIGSLTPRDWQEAIDKCDSRVTYIPLSQFLAILASEDLQTSCWVLEWALGDMAQHDLERFMGTVFEVRPDLERPLEEFRESTLPSLATPPSRLPVLQLPPTAVPLSQSLSESEQEVSSRTLRTEYAPPPPKALPHDPWQARRPGEVGPSCCPPPPPVPRRSDYLPALLLLGVLASACMLLLGWRSRAQLFFAGQMLLLIVIVCATPTIAQRLIKHRGRVARVVSETLLFTASLAGFGFWILGTAASGVWIVYAFVLILLLEVGGHLVDFYRDTTFNRLAETVFFKNMQRQTETFEKMFRAEEILYISVPIGLVAGTALGLARNQTPDATLALGLQIILLLASLVLLFFLVYAFVRMKDPLFRITPVSSPQVAVERTNQKQRKGLIGRMGMVLRLLAPPYRRGTADRVQTDLDLSCMVADLRKVYLYDAVHNVVLLVAFATTGLGLWGIAVDVKWLLASLLGLSLIFNQLPYVLGQSALHEKVLERYEGTMRADISQKLKKYSPLFPASDFLAALLTTGTGGAIMVALIESLVKEVLK